MSYRLTHWDQLAKPKKVHPQHVADRNSVYWKDEIVDERPATVTHDPEKLMEFYDREIEKFPRSFRLAKPKNPFQFPAQDPKFTEHGVSKAAMRYEPSERIKMLSQYTETQKRRRQSPPPRSALGSMKPIAFPPIMVSGSVKAKRHGRTVDMKMVPRPKSTDYQKKGATSKHSRPRSASVSYTWQSHTSRPTHRAEGGKDYVDEDKELVNI